MQQTFRTIDVSIREVKPTPVAIMEHHGDPAMLGATIQRFIGWRKANGFSPKTSKTFNVFHSDPRTTNLSEFRLDLCVEVPLTFETSDANIISGTLPGGRCAVLRVSGNTDDLEPAALYLYRDWLPNSGEEAQDFPLYCQRIAFFPEVAEHETIAELYLPLK